MSEPVDWESLPPDPDVREDLGYEVADMEVIETNNGSDRLLFLPRDEEMIRSDTFIIATKDTVVDLIDRR